jgi:hypothetical protein
MRPDAAAGTGRGNDLNDLNDQNPARGRRTRAPDEEARNWWVLQNRSPPVGSFYSVSASTCLGFEGG